MDFFNSYKLFVPEVDNESFNKDFGLATSKFIDLKSEESRQKQFDDSLIKIKTEPTIENKQLNQLIHCYINIANADDFIHDNEVTLIKHAITIWEMDLTINKPSSGQKLELEK